MSSAPRVLLPSGHGRKPSTRSGSTLIRSLLLLAALALGLLAGLIDVRSATVVPAAVILASSALALALLRPGNAWLYGMLMALCLPLVHGLGPLVGIADMHPPHPNLAATLLAIVPALGGAMVGILIRGALGGAPRRVRSS